nr:MAG TPA: hypothetical protein [Caudoviricetes sp.]
MTLTVRIVRLRVIRLCRPPVSKRSDSRPNVTRRRRNRQRSNRLVPGLIPGTIFIARDILITDMQRWRILC